ncbi:MAG: (4Fe-4S)-binding protein [Ruminococcaceae bacterium]|jgi:ferredoxin|nr:(4Fe-4S)-binding protein [Oscillospiraceae bacterium]
MKRLEKNEALCIGCHQCETACAQAYYKTDDPAFACIRVEDGAGENGTNRIHICNQCGKCSEVCNTCVIQPNPKGVYMLQKKECVGCLMCVGFCPEQVMVQSDDRQEPSKCTACGICAKACPTGAIYIVED